MIIDQHQVVRGVLVILTLFLCSILLILAFYFFYRYRRKSVRHSPTNINSIQKDLNDQQESIKDQSSFPSKLQEEQIIDSLINVNKIIRSNNIERTPRIIEELMRKSLELAKTAEKVADEKEKVLHLKDKLHINIQLENQL
jgi:predicted PurR-regulated permease PerM